MDYLLLLVYSALIFSLSVAGHAAEGPPMEACLKRAITRWIYPVWNDCNFKAFSWPLPLNSLGTDCNLHIPKVLPKFMRQGFLNWVLTGML